MEKSNDPKGGERILVTGAGGQIGSALTAGLRARFGAENVVASDLIHDPEGDQSVFEGGPFTILDATNRAGVLAAIEEFRIDRVIHLAALLSARGEKDPDLAWNINVIGTQNVLSCARDLHLDQVFIPSSIAVYGPGAPKDPAPNDTLLIPSTIYGISKVAGELLGNYYVTRFGLDVRGIRYPGIISAEVLPKGGTTDYSVEMFYAALRGEPYSCFVREDTRLPLMYMKDCLRATLMLMDAPFDKLIHHTNFNIAGLSPTAGEIAAAIRKRIPEFECRFEPDSRQAIADSWPRVLDDSPAREEWGWRPEFDLETLVTDMIDTLGPRLQREKSASMESSESVLKPLRPSRSSYLPEPAAFGLHR